MSWILSELISSFSSHASYHVLSVLCSMHSYYGGRIWESLRDQPNAEVMFHLRNEHYEYCTKNGIDGEDLL